MEIKNKEGKTRNRSRGNIFECSESKEILFIFIFFLPFRKKWDFNAIILWEVTETSSFFWPSARYLWGKKSPLLIRKRFHGKENNLHGEKSEWFHVKNKGDFKILYWGYV